MNYAEDRLDRRARASANADGECKKAEGTPSAATTSTQDQLADDLHRAHDVFASHAHYLQQVLSLSTSNEDDNGKNNLAVRQLLCQPLRELRAAHELAGKTLRDGGQNKQATFHFGLAWIICQWLEKHQTNNNSLKNSSGPEAVVGEAEHEWRAVGDYAQICELAGFPEVGVLALLFYRAGGTLDLGTIIQHSSSPLASEQTTDQQPYWQACGSSPCFIAFPVQSTIINDVLGALDALSVNPFEASFPTALDIHGQLALMVRKSKEIEDPVVAMHAFLEDRQVMSNVPLILQFWGDEDATTAQQRQTANGNGNDDRWHLSNTQQQSESVEMRRLPPVILLLLLKLLYSSPIAGPFLQLACISLPYLAASFPPANPVGRMLARKYKSHNAYYVFIAKLILGERVKKHRKGIFHNPVWDVIFGLDADKIVQSKKKQDKDKDTEENAHCQKKFSGYCNRILVLCSSTYDQHQSTPLPSIIQQRTSSHHSTHPPIFVVGDSHVLSLAWQTLCIKTLMSRDSDEQSPIYRTVFPFPATGMKAWHTRQTTCFFTNYNLHACLQRLPPTSSGRTIILSAGEIDCREGIGGSLLQGYYHRCGDAVERTVVEYLSSLADLAKEYQLQILVMPVASHAYRSEKNGKATGRAKRRETMFLWNEILRRELKTTETNNPTCKYNKVFLLDYEKKLQHPDTNSPVGYVLHPAYNADYTHVNSAIVPLVEEAILGSGCDLALV